MDFMSTFPSPVIGGRFIFDCICSPFVSLILLPSVPWVVDLYWLYAPSSFDCLPVFPLESANGRHKVGAVQFKIFIPVPATLVSFYWVAFSKGCRDHWFLGRPFLLCLFRPKSDNGLISAPLWALHCPVGPLNPAHMSINSFFIEISSTNPSTSRWAMCFYWDLTILTIRQLSSLISGILEKKNNSVLEFFLSDDNDNEDNI